MEIVVVAVIVVTPVPLRETDCAVDCCEVLPPPTTDDDVWDGAEGGGGVSFSRLVGCCCLLAEELLWLLAAGDKLVIELVADVERDDPWSPSPPPPLSLDVAPVAEVVVPSLVREISWLLMLAEQPAAEETPFVATGVEEELALLCCC